MNSTEILLKTKLNDIENVTIMQVDNELLLSIIKEDSIRERSMNHLEKISRLLFSSNNSMLN